MIRSMTDYSPSRRNRRAGGLAVALAMVVTVIVAVQGANPAPANAGYCANYTIRWTQASSSFEGVWASWGSQSVTYGAPCSDVNVKQTNQNDYGPDIVKARGAYFSPSHSRWIHGSAGWVASPKNVQIQTITNLPQTGISIQNASNRVSTRQEIGT